MFEKLKEYSLYIVLGIISIGLIFSIYLKLNDSTVGSNFQDLFQKSVISSNHKDEIVKKSTTISGLILDSFDEININGKKIDDTSMGFLFKETYLDIASKGYINEDGLSLLEKDLNGKIRIYIFSGVKTGLNGKDNISTFLFKNDNTIEYEGGEMSGRSIELLDEPLKGYSMSGYGLGIFTKEESEKLKSSYFGDFEIYQFGTTGKYLLVKEFQNGSQGGTKISLNFDTYKSLEEIRDELKEIIRNELEELINNSESLRYGRYKGKKTEFILESNKINEKIEKLKNKNKEQLKDEIIRDIQNSKSKLSSELIGINQEYGTIKQYIGELKESLTNNVDNFLSGKQYLNLPRYSFEKNGIITKKDGINIEDSFLSGDINTKKDEILRKILLLKEEIKTKEEEIKTFEEGFSFSSDQEMIQGLIRKSEGIYNFGDQEDAKESRDFGDLIKRMNDILKIACISGSSQDINGLCQVTYENKNQKIPEIEELFRNIVSEIGEFKNSSLIRKDFRNKILILNNFVVSYLNGSQQDLNILEGIKNDIYSLNTNSTNEEKNRLKTRINVEAKRIINKYYDQEFQKISCVPLILEKTVSKGETFKYGYVGGTINKIFWGDEIGFREDFDLFNGNFLKEYITGYVKETNDVSLHEKLSLLSNTNEREHVSKMTGKHLIKLCGNNLHLHLGNNEGTGGNIQNINQFGNSTFASMEKFLFNSRIDHFNATDFPDTSEVRDFSRMFDTSTFNGNLSGFNVSKGENFYRIFGSSKFNNDSIRNWNVSNGTNFQDLFAGGKFNNNAISNWNVSNGRNFRGMFYKNTAFNQPLNWNVSNGRNFELIFKGATSFNQPLNWDVRNGTNFSSLFEGATSFNQNLSNWNPENAENVLNLFKDLELFHRNQKPRKWLNWKRKFNHSKFNEMKVPLSCEDDEILSDDGTQCLSPIFEEHGIIKAKNIAIGGRMYTWRGEQWYVAQNSEDVKRKISENFPSNRIITTKVTDMSSLFNNELSGFNGDISNWDVSNVTNMMGMFFTSEFNGDISNWDVSNVTDMSVMFSMSKFNGDISNWNVLNVRKFNAMFVGSKFQQNINKWSKKINISVEINGMFEGLYFDSNQTVDNVYKLCDFFIGEKDIKKFCKRVYVDNNGKTIKADRYAIPGRSYALNGNGEEYYVVRDKNDLIDSLFNRNIRNVVTTKVTDMSQLFKGRDTSRIDVTSWDTSNVTNMFDMFINTNFNQDISKWDTSNVTNMQGMFYGTQFNYNINNWNTSKVTNINYMFKGDSQFNQPLNNWNTSKIESMQGTFEGATSFNQPLNNWNTTNVRNLSVMFHGSTSFNQDISSWNTSNVEKFSYLFLNATSFNQNISNWNVSNGKLFNETFKGATSFNHNINNWNVMKGTNFENMFEGTNYSHQLSNLCRNEHFERTNGHLCPQIGRKNNGVLYAKPTSVGGREYEFEGKNYYIAQDLRDLKQKVNSGFKLDQIITTKVTSFQDLFLQRTSFNGSVSNWDTSNVVSLERTFSGSNFNQDISKWDVSNVTKFNGLFFQNSQFNSDISGWDVRKGIEFVQMFASSNFNQNIGNWCLESAENIASMFNSSKYNQLLNNWFKEGCGMKIKDVSNLFTSSSFNQNINDWNVSNVEIFDNMFSRNSSFNWDLSWEMSSAKKVSRMFYYYKGGGDMSNLDLGPNIRCHGGYNSYFYKHSTIRSHLPNRGYPSDEERRQKCGN